MERLSRLGCTFAFAFACGACGSTPHSSVPLGAGNVRLLCGAGGPTTADVAPAEGGVELERVAIACRWEGEDVAVFKRVTDGALFYRPPFKPYGEVEVDATGDPSGSTLVMRLRTQVPNMLDACPREVAVSEDALRAAQPLPLDAVTLALQEPIVTAGCVLRSPGAEHAFGAAEVIRIVLPAAVDAGRLMRAMNAHPDEVALNVRFAVHGLRRVPRCYAESEAFHGLTAHALLTRLREGTRDDSAVYVTDAQFRQLAEQLHESVRGAVHSFPPYECPPSLVDRFVTDTLGRWEQPLGDAEIGSALAEASAAAGPTGDEQALAQCRAWFASQSGVSAQVQVALPIVGANVGAHHDTGHGSSSLPCPGGLVLHKLVLTDIDASALLDFTMLDHVAAGETVETTVHGGMCSQVCDGCCTSAGECINVQRETDQQCGAGEPAGLCASCAQFATCVAGACEEVQLEGVHFSVTLDQVRTNCVDGDGSPCDLRVHVEAAGAAPQIVNGGDNASTISPHFTLAGGSVQDIPQAWHVRIIDQDVFFDDDLGGCELIVPRQLLQEAASRETGTTVSAIECGAPGQTLTIHVAARVDEN